MIRTAAIVALCTVALAACNTDSPMQMDHDMSAHGLSLASLSSTNSQALAELKQLSAPFHDVDAAVHAGYGLLTLPPATAPDGCISSMSDGGMGYHYTKGTNIADDSIPSSSSTRRRMDRARTAKRARVSRRSSISFRSLRSGRRLAMCPSSARRRCTISRRRRVFPTSPSRRRRASVDGCFTSGCGKTTRTECSQTGTRAFRSATTRRFDRLAVVGTAVVKH